MSMLESEVIGKIEIWVMRDGKMPSKVDGLSDYGTINVLSSLVSHINKQMANKGRDYWEKWGRDEVRHKLYNAMAQIFGTEDPFPMIDALVWMLNRINQRAAQDHHIEKLGETSVEIVQ